MSETPSTPPSRPGRVTWGVVGVFTIAVVGFTAVLVAGTTRDDPAAGPEQTESAAATSDRTSEPTEEDETHASDPEASVTLTIPLSDYPPAPRGVLGAYLAARVHGDCLLADQFVSEDFLEDQGYCADEPTPSGADQIIYRTRRAVTDHEAGTALVPVVVRYEGLRDTVEFELVFEVDRWKVDQAPEEEQ